MSTAPSGRSSVAKSEADADAERRAEVRLSAAAGAH